MRSLVSGGAGFIGSTLVDALLASGDSVLVLDDLSSGRESNLAAAMGSAAGAGVTLARGDITDRDFVTEQFAGFSPERVFHLAAQVDVRRSLADPAFDAAVNVGGTINLLETTREYVPEAPFVFASTGGAIYGEGDGRRLPFDEQIPADPEAAYGVSKLSAEHYLGLFRRLHGVAAVAMRFGNVYGPRQDPHGEAGVVAIFCGKLREGEPLTVFGDGLQTRDYVFVSDVVDSLLAAAATLADRGSDLAGPFNVGTGVETSLLELIAGLEEATGIETAVEHLPERQGEVRRISLDAGAAARELGWRAATGLTDGLGLTYQALAAE